MVKDIIKKFIPVFLLDWYYLSLPFLGAIFYRFPSKKIKVIGVTGTNGKSTVVSMIAEILKEAGFKTASLSSIKFKIADKEWVNTLKMTMPGRMKLQKFLRQAVDAGCEFAVLEVTSEGIKQHRHSFIDFDTAVFTNLSKEHIERHGSFEKYREAKGKLFRACKNIHIINRDDENAEYFLQFPAKKKYGFDLCDDLYEARPHTSCMRPGLIQGLTQHIGIKDIQPLNLKLLGDFNIYNALAAISVGLSQGIDLEICKRAVEKIENIPGRMELVIKEPFKVFVDYAHTPAALRKVYETLLKPRPQTPNPKLICVLGAAGGGRDKWKRPELGKIAAQYCDQIILTNEDPYDESPEKILEDVARGAPDAQKILDRREAIKTALGLANPGDAVIITGKGSEPWMCVKGGKKIPWSDNLT
ncbi:MAG: UDP-N-acetylmuramoyl-L-alanyl-D-glutamate--2,6-diaminopimelate ligase [Candidatus Nealsonbacteria bacterium]|nr:UDP-N-acetylmuramoyl-L-alanyl-D-glutamate--2,6-diaminopimelate ligase [Candidatus Nealsonbacteria bacterium]